MRTLARRSYDPVSASVSAAVAGPARSLSRTERAGLEDRLGGDLSALRVHEGPAADRASAALGARGFAVGRHVALGSAARPDTLAHEAAHALQQDMAEPRGTVPVTRANVPAEGEARAAASGTGGSVMGGQAPVLARDLIDPGRLGEVHQGVMVEGPPRTTAGGGATTRRPWVDPSRSDGGTAAVLEQDVIDFFRGSQLRPMTARTTERELDTDATAVNRRVVARFPQIPSPLSDQQVPDRARLSTPAEVRQLPGFLEEWFDNTLHQLSTSEDYAIDTTNAAYQAMRTRLLNHNQVGPLLAGLAARQSAFTAGEEPERRVFMHEKVSDAERTTTLIHEFVHLYRHTRFRDWAQSTADPNIYNEGITEWLARKVMTADELSGRDRYQPRVDAVNQQIAPHVPEDDIARAVFRGEVWRLETRSAGARSAFEAQTGISETGTREEEIAASRTAGGFFQAVVPGDHYRFINLGIAESQPKSEHEAAFRGVKTSQFDPNPTVKFRFIGHASGPGSESYNMDLSRRRSVAFYRMARREGVPWNRMVDAERPPHFGESRPTATEEDVITRAMNRRVEMFLIRGGPP